MRRSSILFLLFFLVAVPLIAAKPAPPSSPFVPAIAYIQAKSGGNTDLMLMNAEGTQKKVLVAGSSALRPRAPSFSPDGTKIVFRYGAALYVVPTAGGTPWRIVTLAEDHGWNTPAWSPDGRFILYSDSTDPSAICGCADHDMFLLEVDSSGHAVAGSGVRLTATPAMIEYESAWSRDGTRFVAKVWINGNEQQLFVFDFDPVSRAIVGSSSLTAGLGPMFFGPWRAQWNKSATAFPNDVVVFSAHFKNDGSNYNLWYIDAVTRLAGHIVATNANFEGSPSFSPSDARIVFHNESANGQSLHNLSIVENAADIIRGSASTPVITFTAAAAGGKIFDVYEADWKPVP